MNRLLFISHRIPYPPDKGDKIRSYNLLKFFASHYKVDLVTFVDNKSDLKYQINLNEFCQHCFVFERGKKSGILRALYHFCKGKSLSEGLYYSKNVQDKINKLIGENDYKFIFAYSSQVAQYVAGTKIRKIIDFCDVDSEKWIEYSNKRSFPLNLVYAIEGRRLAERERIIAEKFDLILFATERETALFSKDYRYPNCIVLPNGVDFKYFSPSYTEKEESLIFVGAMDYYPNVEAVLWFTKKVFNHLVQHIPTIHFYIVGSNPDKKLMKLADLSPNITVTGYVQDIRPFLDKSKAAVIPIDIARGIQNKVLEAMAMEVPVVISQNIYKSLINTKDINLLVYKDESDLLKTLLHLMDKDNLNYEKIGKDLRNYVIKNYNWHTILSGFHQELRTRFAL